METLEDWKQKAKAQGIDASSCSNVPCVKQKMSIDTITEIPDISKEENYKQSKEIRQQRR